LHREKEESNVVTPPPSKRPKMTSTKLTKQEDRKGKESDGNADENKNEYAHDGMRSESDDGKAEDDDKGRQEKLKKGKRGKAIPAKKGAKKSATKKTSPKEKSPLLSNNTKSPPMNLPTIDDIKTAHMGKETSEEDALLSIMFVHYKAGNKSLAFETIASDLGYKAQNEGLENAWKDLRSKKLVEEAARGKTKVCRLTKKGIDAIPSMDYKGESANPPKTTSELHERIRNDAVNEYGKQIFDFLLEARGKSGLMWTKDVAKECGVSIKTKKFMCAMRQLKDNGYVIQTPTKERNMILSDKCFLDDWT